MRRINYQLQDVVTHGNFKDRILNHNLFTIGDGNDANVDDDSDEDDDDVIDVDGGGVVDRQANKQSKFANFALNADKSAGRHRNATRTNGSSRAAVAVATAAAAAGAGAGGADSSTTNTAAAVATNRMGDGSNRSNHMIQRQNQSDASNNKQLNNEQHELNQGQQQLEDNMMATRLPNRQMTYKHTSKSRGLFYFISRDQFSSFFLCFVVVVAVISGAETANAECHP